MSDWSALLARDNGGVWEWFRERLGTDAPAEEISGFLETLHRNDRAALAEDIATEWETAVAGAAGREAECLAIWRMRAGWEGGDAAVVRAGEKLGALYRKDGRRRRMVEGAGFDKGVALDEAFRRFGLLLRLAPKTFVLDKNWGFGVVRELDDFYGKVVVDFARKPGHEVTFAYAGENFELLDNTHFYARNHSDPQGFVALACDNPAEVVKLALRSFGPLTAPKLQELLCATVVPAKNWKTFWDNARKALKNDPCMAVPVKRSEPLRVLAQEQDYGDAWFVILSAERDIERIFDLMKELAAQHAPAELTPSQRDAVGERLAYVIHARGDRDAALRMRAVMAAAAWNVPTERVDTVAERKRLLAGPPLLLDALQSLPAREGGALLEFLTEDGHADELTTCLIELLPELPSAPLNEAMDFLIEHQQQTAVASRLRTLVSGRTVGVELLYWLSRHTDMITEWKLGSPSELPFLIMAALEPYYNGDQLRTANQLEARLQDREWLAGMTATMTHLQRASMIQYLRDAAGRTTVDTQSLIARLVILHPELNELLVASDKAAQPQHKLTSWRKHRERQLQLQKLINEEIPKNSRDIGQARSYGDLSENFEFKAAKEQQSILMHRQAQWEADLQNIHGTDFRGFPATVAGMGVTVALEYADGRSETFHILGEWDQDLALGIISCSSRMGQVLKGHISGDEVLVPDANGDVPAKIVSVKAIPDTILTWARGD